MMEKKISKFQRLQEHASDNCRGNPQTSRIPKILDNIDVEGPVEEQFEESFRNHAALCQVTDRNLAELFANDSFLTDIPYDISPSEILDQIAVIHGQAITIYLKREPLTTLKIVVPESKTTVLDLKKAIQRTHELEHKRRQKTSEQEKLQQQHKNQSNDFRRRSEYADDQQINISWRYIWRTYVLVVSGRYRDELHEQERALSDDRQLISNCGVINKSVLKFAKRSKIKERYRHRN